MNLTVCDRFTPARYKDFVEFFMLNGDEWIDPLKTFHLPGMAPSRTLYAFQLYGVFCMAEMETIQGGGWLADGMGLGKVS